MTNGVETSIIFQGEIVPHGLKGMQSDPRRQQKPEFQRLGIRRTQHATESALAITWGFMTARDTSNVPLGSKNSRPSGDLTPDHPWILTHKLVHTVLITHTVYKITYKFHSVSQLEL